MFMYYVTGSAAMQAFTNFLSRTPPDETPRTPNSGEYRRSNLRIFEIDYYDDKVFDLIREPPSPDSPSVKPMPGYVGPKAGYSPNLMTPQISIRGTCRAMVCSLPFEQQLPLPTLFNAANMILQHEDGYLLITTQHPEMFGDMLERPESLRGQYTYTVNEIVNEAKKWNYAEIKRWEKKLDIHHDSIPPQLLEVGRAFDGCHCWAAVAFKYQL